MINEIINNEIGKYPIYWLRKIKQTFYIYASLDTFKLIGELKYVRPTSRSAGKRYRLHTRESSSDYRFKVLHKSKIVIQ